MELLIAATRRVRHKRDAAEHLDRPTGFHHAHNDLIFIDWRHHLTDMLKLVKSLAAKAERANRTTVEFLPLHKGISHHCLLVRPVRKGQSKGLAKLSRGRS